jgi:hypothetical protein
LPITVRLAGESSCARANSSIVERVIFSTGQPNKRLMAGLAISALPRVSNTITPSAMLSRMATLRPDSTRSRANDSTKAWVRWATKRSRLVLVRRSSRSASSKPREDSHEISAIMAYATIAKVFGCTLARSPSTVSSRIAKITNTKLATGVSSMLDMMIGTVKTKRLRPLANCSGESASPSAIIRKSKKSALANQPET